MAYLNVAKKCKKKLRISFTRFKHSTSVSSSFSALAKAYHSSYAISQVMPQKS
jgi:hypothetical protein